MSRTPLARLADRQKFLAGVGSVVGGEWCLA